MNELISILKIFTVIFLQGAYDFLGWKVILGDEDSGRFSEKVYRVIKFILDFPVTYYLFVTFWNIHWSHIWFIDLPVDVLWFYLLKWLHSCDRVYNWLDKIFYKSEPAHWGYWRWWTFPLGLLRTNWLNIIHISKGWTYKDYILHTGNFILLQNWESSNGNIFAWAGKRGMVNIIEVNNWNNAAYIAFILFYIFTFIINFV